MEAPQRRFTILDGMALVAVAALGAWLFRINLQSVRVQWSAWKPLKDPLSTAYLSYRAACVLQPIIILLATTLLLLGLLPPRPRFNLVMRQPGMVACAAICTVAGIRLLKVLMGFTICALTAENWTTFVFRMDFDVEAPSEWFWLIFFAQTEELVSQTCIAVPATWAALRVSGIWGPSTSWVDRTGRSLGILYLLVSFVLLFIFPLPYESMW